MRKEEVWSPRDGNTIRPFTDKWVPTITNFTIKPIEDDDVIEGLTVEAWIDINSREWRDN